MSLLQKHSEWIYITPIHRLEIGEILHGEIKIGRVIFVDVKKLSRIRKRIGLPIVISKIEKKFHGPKFFKEAKTYAIIVFKGIPELEENNCRKIIEDAVNIISASQLGYCSRHNNSQFGLIKQRSDVSRLLVNKTVFESQLKNSVENKVLPFRLNNDWYEYHKDFFFFDLLKLINNPSKVQKKWKDTLIRAAIMIGKSMQSRDLEYCFLWNMIVIEMLLTEQGDKYSTSLPERAEAFIGWIGYWKENNYEESIKELYAKRCQFVHDGNSSAISINDVLFSEDIACNLFWNIIKHIKIFPSKQNIIDFSEKVKAEKLLGVKPKVQPKTLKFMRRLENDDEIKRL